MNANQGVVRLMLLIGLEMLVANIALAGGAYSSMPDIWIKGGAHLINTPQSRRGVREDMGEMWSLNAPWQAVAARVKVAEFPPGHIEGASNEELQAVFREMKRRNIALALEAGLLTRSDRCASKNEATGGPGAFERMLEKIQRNGGDLRYIAMDEPYYFGHIDESGCHFSAAELASEVAESIAAARQIFPKVQVGDIEVFNPSRAWVEELAGWADAYRIATGEKLAFMQTDMGWTDLAMENLKALSEVLRVRGIPLAIIYNANANAKTDRSWERSAEEHIAEIETALAIHPEIAVFDSWARNPSHALPETEPGTLTNLALRYLRSPSALVLEHRGDTISGQLTDPQHHPVAGANVTITAEDVGARMAPTIRSVLGTAPALAVSAIIGVRIDSEGACVCDGEAGAVLGNLEYKETGTGNRQIVSPAHLPNQDLHTGLFRLKLVPGRPSISNIKQFRVTPRTPYEFKAPIAASASAEHAGYATLIFLDDQEKELKRDFLWFSPSRRDLGSILTDSDGRFALTLPSGLAKTRPQIRVEFLGDDKLRGALAIDRL